MLRQAMAELPSESSDIAIRCPGCGQRFKVGPDLEGRMVECGSCDQRFRVEEDVMIRQRKIYPGEHRDPTLERFGRVPMRSGELPSFQQAVYEAAAPSSVAIEPTSPIRVIFGIVGVVGALIVGLILIFSGAPGGMLDGTPLPKRLVLAGFTAVLTGIMLLVANPHGRLKAALIGLAFAVSLLALPFFFKQGMDVVGGEFDGSRIKVADNLDASEDEEDIDIYAELKMDMTYKPMEKALGGYGPDRVVQGKTAIAVWLRDLRDYNKLLVIDYLVRATSASNDSWLYPRPPDDFLMVLLEVDPDMNKVKELCSRFGEVTRVIKDLQVIEVQVNNETFVQGKLSKLQDHDDPAFYELNRRELESIDLQRADEAVRRLIVAEPKLFRSDIVGRMQQLLLEGDTKLKKNVAKALANWAIDGDGSVEALRKVAEDLMVKDGVVPASVIAFLVENRDPEVIPILDELWSSDAKEWEALYGDFGSAAEPLLLSHFDSLTPILQISAIRILARVGGSKSLVAFKTARKSAKSEIAAQLDNAIVRIEKREAE